MKQQEIKHISHFGYFSLHQLILSIHDASEHGNKQGGKRHLLKKMSANTNKCLLQPYDILNTTMSS